MRIQVWLICLVILIGFASGVGRAGMCTEQSKEPFKIAFIMSGPVSDYGYNYAHNVGRLYLQSHLTNVETSMVENVPESAEVERVMEKLIAQGNRLLFCTSYGYLEPAEKVARRHPDVTIMQGFRSTSLKNMGGYAVDLYEPLYAVGMVAGKMTRTNNIGIVCAHPIPVTLQNINAFLLGARSVNSKLRVHVVWTNSWSDPPTEAEATKGLIDSGADIIGSDLSGPLTVARTADRHHAMTVSNQTDLHTMVPNAWLTGSRWNWGPTFCLIAKSVQDSSWRPGLHWFNMSDGTVELSSFGRLVPKALQTQAMALVEQVKQGKKIVFIGPLKDREGRQRLAAGQAADPKILSEMDWFVEGVDGTLPKR